MSDKNDLTGRIIGCAVEVHRRLGPGLLERTYEAAMAIELELAGIPYQRQVAVPITYREQWVGDYRIDLVVDDKVVVEIKSVERSDPLFEAQLLSYVRASGKPVGLMINFNSHLVTKAIKRVVV